MSFPVKIGISLKRKHSDRREDIYVEKSQLSRVYKGSKGSFKQGGSKSRRNAPMLLTKSTKDKYRLEMRKYDEFKSY